MSAGHELTSSIISPSVKSQTSSISIEIFKMTQNFFARHKILTAIGVVLVIAGIAGASNVGFSSNFFNFNFKLFKSLEFSCLHLQRTTAI